nr:immunoglobulin heavy chain junction region [Mus musculus]MBK4189593.1 immunoglobulin heavy chain junction region [Mus musculus]
CARQGYGSSYPYAMDYW